MTRRRNLTVVIATGLLAVGCSSAGSPPTLAPPPQGPPDLSVELLGTDSLAFRPDDVAALPGRVEVSLTSGSAVGHNVVIEDVNDNDVVVEAGPGQTGTAFVALDPGSYTFFCSIPGHRAAGMEGTLEVQEPQQ